VTPEEAFALAQYDRIDEQIQAIDRAALGFERLHHLRGDLPDDVLSGVCQAWRDDILGKAVHLAGCGLIVLVESGPGGGVDDAVERENSEMISLPMWVLLRQVGGKG